MASSEDSDRPPVVSSKLLQYLAGALTEEWLDVARNLNISEVKLHKIKVDKGGHTKEMIYQTLIYWRRKNGPFATHNILAEALQNAQRSDLSEKVWDDANKARKRSLENEPSCEHAASTSKRQRPTEEPSVNQSAVGDGDMTADMTKKKTQFVRELQKKYEILCGDIQPAPFLRDKYNIDQLFVENGIKFLEDKQGESKEQEKWTMLKDYKTVFTNPNIKSKRRIIDGEPGYGKSTLALQITHDWCHGIAPMNEFQILILLRLRQFRNVTTVYSAIKKFLLPIDSRLTEDDIKSILDCSPTLILLDGYDEYPDLEKEDTDINHIIRGDIFQKHDVVLLTRTSCLPPNHSNRTIKRMRLTGFDDTSRETYIRNVVARGCFDVADNIITFLKVNPVPADLCKIPLFFGMISYMVKNSEIFPNFKTVTQFFKHIIKCFHSHKKIKVTEENRKEKVDHITLDKVAFEGLSGDAQQIYWGKNKLRSEIGKDLYDEYVRIGILIEEEGFNYDTLEFNTETRFFHKLFAEWYAAHYLAKVAARPEAAFEPWPNPRRRAADTSQLYQAANSDEVHTLKSLNPNELQYMYRYACGLNPEAALKIIKHLGKNEDYDEYTLLCMTEWSGNLETIKDTVTLLCSRQIIIRDTDSLLLQKSKVALIEFASRQKIPMNGVQLYDCLDVGYNGSLRMKPSYLHLPVIDTTLGVLEIYEDGREIMEEETDSILQYSAKCLGLNVLLFYDCLFPRYIKVTESISVLRARDVGVMWDLGIELYLLNLESGQWEDYERRRPMTDEQYQNKVKEIHMPTKADVDNYKRLKNTVSFMLQKEDCTKLAKFFKFSSSQMETIRSSRQPAKTFLFVLEEKGKIHPSNVSKLEKAFFTLNINTPCYNKVVSYQNLIMEISPYDKFIAQLASHITLSKARDLCKNFKFTNNMTKSIIASHNPGLSLLLELDKTFFINSTDVKALEVPFEKLVQAVAIIQEYQSQVTQEGSRLQQTTLLTTKDQKKILFHNCLKKKMKYWYDTMTPVPWKRSCKWRSTDLYVGSQLIFKDSQSTNKNPETDKKCKLQYGEIFSHANLASAKRIIVEGEPGCGKTMLTAQLGYDWSQGLIEEVDVLALLPLKFVGNKTLLESIKEFYIPSTIPLEENDIDEILSSTTDTIGVLLDGLEEYGYHESSEVAKVFKENKHPNWKVVLTSRSNCATDLPTFPTLQIDLFGEEERNKYIENLYVGDVEKQKEVKAAINDSAFILDLCSVPLLFVLAVHSLESESSFEKDHFQKAGMFIRKMISTLTANHAIQDEIDGPKTKHSTNSMLYLGEVAFNGFRLERQQLYWQRTFLGSNVGSFQQWIDSGILIIEEDFATTTKEAKQKKELNVKEQDTIPQQDDDDKEKSFASDTEMKMTDEQGSVMQKDRDEQGSNITETDDTPNQTPSMDTSTGHTTSTPTTTKHVPQMVKFLHKVVQEWFAAAYFSTMLKKCTHRDQYEEYVSEHLPHISPTELHYLLRFVCFLHPPFCHTVMNHLLRSYRLKDVTVPTYIMDCIFLCFAEHQGIKDTDTEEVVANVCTEDIIMHGRDSRMLQRAKYAMLKFASETRITIEKVHLTDVIIDAKIYDDRQNDDEKYVMILKFGLEMNVLKTVRKVEVSRWDPMLKEDRFQNILEFLSNGLDIKEIICEFPDPPPSTLMAKTKTKLLENNMTVRWIIGDVVHQYNSTEGIWKCTTKQQMDSSGKGSDQRRPVERNGSLETSAVVSKRRCVLKIAGTGVELHIPPNAFQDHEEEHALTMRILPHYLLDESSQSFEDRSTAAVEILPNKAILQSAAKLVLPHCLEIRNPRHCDVQIFQSHHEPCQKPLWENISGSESFVLSRTFCEISLKKFCWVTFKLACGDELLGKRLVVYATGTRCKENQHLVTALVGYYPAVPGGNMIYEANRKENVVTQSFIFPKEPPKELQIEVITIKPDVWKPDKSREVIPFNDIEFSDETYHSFIFEKSTSRDSAAPLSLCRFKVSKGAKWKDLLLDLQQNTTNSTPLPTHSEPSSHVSIDKRVVSKKVCQKLCSTLGKDWLFVGRELDLEEDVLQNIKEENSDNCKEMAYQMLLSWIKSKGGGASYEKLEKALSDNSRGDLVLKVKDFRAKDPMQ